MKLHLIRIAKIILIVLSVLTTLNTCVLAAGGYDVTGKFDGTTTANINAATKSTKNILFTIFDTVRYIGIAIAIIMLMYIGVKFMTAAPSERANIKQYMINYVIGACILLGASGILTIVKNVADNAFKVT